MQRQGTIRGSLGGLAAALLLAACGAGPGTTPGAPASVTQDSPPGTASTPSASPDSVSVARDVRYESTNPLLRPGMLDVYAPVTAGSWPIVVMFHGSPPTNSKGGWGTQARAVAAQGFVVFVADWGHPSRPAPSGLSTSDGLQAGIAESTCAVAFAQAHAAEYGGDAATTILFGHSAGANEASMIAFARPTPASGCLGSPTLGPIHALITWDSDWMAIDPTWDEAVATDSRLMTVYTPWASLAQPTDLTVTILASEDPSPYRRDVSDPATATAFFAGRDPSGTLRRQLEASGALADGFFDVRELQEFFFSVLKARGYAVSLAILPGSTHDVLGSEGARVLVAAFANVKGD